MNALIEMMSQTELLFCVGEQYGESEVYAFMRPFFKNIERTSPSLLLKRMQQKEFSLVYLDGCASVESDFVHTLEKIHEQFPRTTLIAEAPRDDAVQIHKLIDLNLDKIILTPIRREALIGQLQRILVLHYELLQSSKYEQQLESIIFGQNRTIKTQQTQDELTGLKNIAGLKERFTGHMQRALLFLDIDRFDTINTLYGMRVGDRVLQFITRRLDKFLPHNAELFRISADEFVILIEDPKKNQASMLGDQIIAMFMEAPIAMDNITLDVSFSIGYDVGESYEIFNNAKIATREAKYQGGRVCVAYSDNSRFLKLQQENHFWINEIKEALKEDRIEVYFQPMFCNQAKKITKYESLARLISKNGDVITPNFFIKPAIMSELISAISRTVIDKTFKVFSKNSFEFSINLSDQDFAEGYLEEYLVYKSKMYNINPNRVFLEILEETSLNEKEGFKDQIEQLRTQGFRFSIDDFGIEKSNFARVLELKADVIKIDGSFIRTFPQDSNSRIIIESIIDFSKKIGAITVAEYVETQEVFEELEHLGVDYAQGYFVGKPSPSLVTRFD